MRYLLLALLLSVPQLGTAAVVFQDDFEGSIDPGWGGPHVASFYVSDEHAQSGNYCVSTGRVYDRILLYDLGSAQTDTTFDAWIYDGMLPSKPAETLVSVATTDPSSSSTTTLSVGLDTSVDTGSYIWLEGWGARSGSVVSRSLGWHRVQIFTDGSVSRCYVDEILIHETAFGAGFRYCHLYANGKQPTPDRAPNFWDNAMIYTGLPIPVELSIFFAD